LTIVGLEIVDWYAYYAIKTSVTIYFTIDLITTARKYTHSKELVKVKYIHVCFSEGYYEFDCAPTNCVRKTKKANDWFWPVNKPPELTSIEYSESPMNIRIRGHL